MVQPLGTHSKLCGVYENMLHPFPLPNFAELTAMKACLNIKFNKKEKASE